MAEGALHRAVAEIIIESTQARRKRERRDAEMGLSEILQQVQVEFSGVAGTGWGFANATITFDYPFYYAPGQRDPDFEHPHFMFGAEVTQPVAASGVVLSWTVDDDNGAIIGCVVAIGVCAGTTLAYSGVAHLSFQGFSALAEDEITVND